MPKPLLPPLHLHHLQTLALELHKLHSTKLSLPPDHTILNTPYFDPDVILKPILSTYYPSFTRLFGEQCQNIWIAFNAALLKVWDWGDVGMASEGFWECVGQYFEVSREDRVVKSSKEKYTPE
ncbi:hypothetical protein TWF281_010324 [Arthrobotrys megalospora]